MITGKGRKFIPRFIMLYIFSRLNDNDTATDYDLTGSTETGKNYGLKII